MNIVKTITDSRIPALVSQVRETYEEYQRLRERYVTFTKVSSSSDPVETKLREICAGIPAMQQEAEGSAVASAFLYAGLSRTLSDGQQAVAQITGEITRMERERADAEAEARRKQEEAEKAERYRKEAKKAASRRSTAAKIRLLCFILKRVLVIILPVAFVLAVLSGGEKFDEKTLFWGCLGLTWIICVFPYPDIRIAVFEGIALGIIGVIDAVTGGKIRFLLLIPVIIASLKLLAGRAERWLDDH